MKAHEYIDYETGETKKHFVRSAFNYSKDAVSDETGLACPEPTLTQQQFKEDADINTIVERFGLTGELPTNLRVPTSGDFSEEVNDYQSAMNMVIKAQEAFMEMPAEIRERFNNDPDKFIKFTENPDNREEAKKMGLLAPEPAAERPIRVVMDTPPTEPAKPPAGTP